MVNFLENLNDAQRRAVEYIDGPSMIIAGAGSGKTRTLTYKIAYLLTQGYQPRHILALTFTNKAAREMKERVERILGGTVGAYPCDRPSDGSARTPTMGTFHSVFARILRVEAERIGYQPNYTIYDESDSRSLLTTIIRDMGLDDKLYRPATIRHRIGIAKNHLIMPDDYARDRSLLQRDRECRLPRTADIYAAYVARCRRANAMDFDDLLTNTYLLLRDHDEVRRHYADRFRFVLVDEYQDTNRAQQEILTLLTREHRHICVVGDDAQSIYAFRGANIDNMLDFNRIYPDVRLFRLERNYRSTQRIVQAAGSLIKHNSRQIAKEIYSENAAGSRIIYKPTHSDKEEALTVCREIRRLKRSQGLDDDDFAILYRTNAQSRTLEEALRKADIPYRIYGGMSFYQRKEIKDAIAYFRLVVNADDEEALRRIVNYPARGIGATTVERIVTAADEHKVSMWTVCGRTEEYAPTVGKAAATRLKTFHTMIEGFRSRSNVDDCAILGRRIVAESGITADITADKSPEGIARNENMEELLNALQDFADSRREEDNPHITIADFLQEVSLMTDREDERDDSAKRVSLMTVHSAKGLEFPVVFIVGLEENIFPSPMALESIREIEEERRLLYVAITRAEQICIITNAQYRMRWGQLQYNRPSRFISEIDPALLTTDDDDTQSSYGSREKLSPRANTADLCRGAGDHKDAIVGAYPCGRQPDANAVEGTPLSPGDTIEHERFGIGTVLDVEGMGENTKTRVKFKNAGEKQLLLKFARYKVITT